MTPEEIEDCIPDGICVDYETGRCRVSVHLLYEFARRIAAAEREACAKVCEEMRYVNPQPYHYAHAIRARSDT